MTQHILPLNSPIHTLFSRLVGQSRMIFLVGLPGTGKSLLLKQLALLAQQADRTVHMLQYDAARLPFETAEILAKYPEIDGFTHAAIRKATGLWCRFGVTQWASQFPEAEHLLLGELPLIGNRLIELTQPHEDEAEALLADESARFVLPVPSTEVRAVIEAARRQTSAAPQHDLEKQDAQPNVVQSLWEEVVAVGQRLGLCENGRSPQGMPYDPQIYTAVYQHLLTHRHHHILPVDTVLKPGGSAYGLTIPGTQLAATPPEVDQIMTQIEQRFTPETLETAVANWYE